MLIFAFVVALLAVLGPDLLKFLLIGTTSFVPVSEQTLRRVLILFCIIVLTGMIYRKLVTDVMSNSERLNERNTKRVTFLGCILTLEHTLAIIWVFLIVFNGLLSEFREKWCSFMNHHTELFIVIRFAGIIFLAVLVGYCFGRRHKRPTKTSKSDKGNFNDENAEAREIIDSIILEENPECMNKGEKVLISDYELNISLPASAEQKLK